MSYSNLCSKRGIEPSDWDAPITAAIPIADVTHRYNAENATECASTFTQFAEFGLDDAAFNSAITHPATKNVSAIATGSVFVCLSAAKQ
jgi:hypothetical protein